MEIQSKESQQLRMQYMAPLFETLIHSGRNRVWLARELYAVGVVPSPSRSTVVNYERGLRRIPPGFVEAMCRLLAIPPSLVPLTGPPEVLIQPPKKPKAPAVIKPKPSRQKKGSILNGHTVSHSPTSTRAPRVSHARAASSPPAQAAAGAHRSSMAG